MVAIPLCSAKTSAIDSGDGFFNSSFRFGWREKYGDIHADSPFIEFGKLVSLLDSIGQREKNTDKKLVLDIMTAIKSILVLNMCASERKN